MVKNLSPTFDLEFSNEYNNFTKLAPDTIQILVNEWITSEKENSINEAGFDDYSLPSQSNPKDLDFIFENFKKLAPLEIDNILNGFVKNKINFDKAIGVIVNNPSGEELEIAKTSLRKFEDEEYINILNYIKSSDIDNFVKSYFIETIVEWNSIDIKKRLKDLTELLNEEKNDTVYTKTLKYSIQELSDVSQ